MMKDFSSTNSFITLHNVHYRRKRLMWKSTFGSVRDVPGARVLGCSGASRGRPMVSGFFLIVALLCFVLTVMAVLRHVPTMRSAVAINLLLGWTFIGWVIALAMAARSRPTRV